MCLYFAGMLLDQVQSLERRLGSNFFSFAARFCSRRSWLQTRNRRINRVEKLKSTHAKHPKPTTLQHANAGNAVCLSAYTRQSHESRIRPLPCLALRYLFCPGPIKSSQNGEKHSNHGIKAFDATHSPDFVWICWLHAACESFSLLAMSFRASFRPWKNGTWKQSHIQTSNTNSLLHLYQP